MQDLKPGRRCASFEPARRHRLAHRPHATLASQALNESKPVAGGPARGSLQQRGILVHANMSEKRWLYLYKYMYEYIIGREAEEVGEDALEVSGSLTRKRMRRTRHGTVLEGDELEAGASCAQAWGGTCGYRGGVGGALGSAESVSTSANSPPTVNATRPRSMPSCASTHVRVQYERTSVHHSHQRSQMRKRRIRRGSCERVNW